MLHIPHWSPMCRRSGKVLVKCCCLTYGMVFVWRRGGKKPFAGNKPPDGVHVYFNSILWVSKGHKSLLNHRSGLGFLILFSVKRDGLFSFTHVCWNICNRVYVCVPVKQLFVCPEETQHPVLNPVLTISLSHLCPLYTPSPLPAPLQLLSSAAVWNVEWHFKVFSVSWNQVCISIRETDLKWTRPVVWRRNQQ